MEQTDTMMRGFGSVVLTLQLRGEISSVRVQITQLRHRRAYELMRIFEAAKIVKMTRTFIVSGTPMDNISEGCMGLPSQQ
jgi:hypothetical protein